LPGGRGSWRPVIEVTAFGGLGELDIFILLGGLKSSWVG
jgi:hypothetical protein